MAALTHLDTHVLVWLYLPRLDLLSDLARDTIEDPQSALAVSPMAILELTYLYEIGRLRVGGEDIFAGLERDLNLTLDRTPFADVVAKAHPLSWTRDPFDRLIAAQALSAGARLVSSDGAIRQNLASAVW